MRVLYLSADPGIPVLGRKGASIHVRELAFALASRGVSVTVASPRIDPEGDEVDASVELARIPPVVPGDHADASSLRRAMAEQTAEVAALAHRLGVDAIYERFSLFSAAGVRSAAGLGLPHVLEMNSPLRAEAARFRTLPHPELAAAVEQEVREGTERILAVSAALAGLLAREGVPGRKLEVVPNGVAAARFAPRSASGGESFTVGFAGSLKPWHGVEVLLEAAEAALAEEARLRFEVVGDGPLAAAIGAAALPPARFAWHGALPHAAVLERMRSWRAGVAPYVPVPDFYFSPLKVLEYMAVGLCPVASDLGQIRDLLHGGTRGVLVPAGDAAALAEALVGLARQPGRAARLGEAARAHVLAEHSWQRNADRVLEALATPAEGQAA